MKVLYSHSKTVYKNWFWFSYIFKENMTVFDTEEWILPPWLIKSWNSLEHDRQVRLCWKINMANLQGRWTVVISNCPSSHCTLHLKKQQISDSSSRSWTSYISNCKSHIHSYGRLLDTHLWIILLLRQQPDYEVDNRAFPENCRWEMLSCQLRQNCQARLCLKVLPKAERDKQSWGYVLYQRAFFRWLVL